MNLKQLPVIEQIIESGAEDRIFDGLLLIGPLVIFLIAVLGRSVFTQILAVSYIAVFLVHVLRNVRR